MFEVIKEFFTGRSFEFYTQYELDDCKTILESASVRKPDENPSDGSTLLVKTTIVNEKQVAFTMWESDLKLNGVIQKVDAGVLVSGLIKIRCHKLTVMFLIAPYACALITSIVSEEMRAIMFLFVLIALPRIILPQEFNRLDNTIHRLLGKSEKKKNNN